MVESWEWRIYLAISLSRDRDISCCPYASCVCVMRQALAFSSLFPFPSSNYFLRQHYPFLWNGKYDGPYRSELKQVHKTHRSISVFTLSLLSTSRISRHSSSALVKKVPSETLLCIFKLLGPKQVPQLRLVLKDLSNLIDGSRTFWRKLSLSMASLERNQSVLAEFDRRSGSTLENFHLHGLRSKSRPYSLTESSR